MTKTEEEWMRRHWPYMRNAFCGMILGKHPRTTVRMARKLGLVKSPEFISTMRKESLEKAKASNSERMRGTYPINLQKWNNRKKNNPI